MNPLACFIAAAFTMMVIVGMYAGIFAFCYLMTTNPVLGIIIAGLLITASMAAYIYFLTNYE